MEVFVIIWWFLSLFIIEHFVKERCKTLMEENRQLKVENQEIADKWNIEKQSHWLWKRKFEQKEVRK